jgi:hypothetical protein
VPDDEGQACLVDLLATGQAGEREPDAMVHAGKDLGFVLEVVERGQPAAPQGVGEEARGGRVGGQSPPGPRRR